MKRRGVGAVILLIAVLVTISGAVVAQLPTPTAEVWDTWQPAAVTMVKAGTVYANLRAQPNLSAAIVGRVYPGSAEVSYTRAADGWQRVRVVAGVGWVSETVARVTVIVTIMPTATPTRAATATPSATRTPAVPTVTATVSGVVRALDLLAQAEALEAQAALLRAQAVALLQGGD